jgi:hypothetical protein
MMLARASLLLLALSSIGPFSLGYLKANHLDHANMYRFAIYFYLHFQYNGFFLFGILSLLMTLVEEKLSERDLRRATLGSYMLIFACLPAYFLSILWSQPNTIFNIIGFAAALTQLIGLYFFIPAIRTLLTQVRLTTQERLLFLLSFVSLGMKSTLQLISAYPAAAAFANEFRSVVIAYLHLVLLGGISLFLIAWLIHKEVIPHNVAFALGLILIGFISSEVILAILPWNGNSFENDRV